MLSNGIPVVYAAVHAFPVVSVNLVLEAGGTRDQPELAGLASFTASLLETGAGDRSAAEIAEQVESLGVQLDAGASWDTAHAALTALRSRLEPALDILADLVRRPTFPQGEVDRVRAQRLAEILQRRADPRSLATETAARFVYAPETPFSRPLGGTTATVERLTSQDALAFHAQHVGPGGATVIVVGDLEVEAAVALLESRLGDWSGGGLGHPVPVESRALTSAPQVVVVDRPGAVQSEIRLGHLGVARAVADYFALVVMNAILGGMFSSRLNLNLRERHGFTYGASSGFSMRRQAGSFMVSTAVQTEVTAAAVAEVLHELRAIREAPVTPAELGDAQNYLAGIFPLRLQTSDGIAGRVAELVVYDLAPGYFDTYRDRILAVTADEVQQAALRHVRPDEAVLVVVGDAARIRESLEALGLAPVRTITADQLDSLAT